MLLIVVFGFRESLKMVMIMMVNFLDLIISLSMILNLQLYTYTTYKQPTTYLSAQDRIKEEKGKENSTKLEVHQIRIRPCFVSPAKDVICARRWWGCISLCNGLQL